MLTKIRTVLTPREQRRGIVVLLMLTVLAILQVAGVASIMPFLAVLGNPDMVESNNILRWAYETGRFASVHDFLMALGVGAFLLVVFSALFRIASTYASNRYIQMRRYSISVRLLRHYLRQPYDFFLGRNIADLSKGVFFEADTVASKVIKPIMDLIANGLVVVVLIGLILAVDPILALIVTSIVGGLYAVVYFAVRTRLRAMGAGHVTGNRDRFKAANEALSGIKDLKLLGREQVYLRRFRNVAARLSRFWYLQATLSATPRYVVEAVGFGGVMALAIVLTATRGDLGEVLPLLGLYTFGAYRLLPAAQLVYSSASTLRFGGPALDVVYEDLRQEAATSEEPPVTGGGYQLEREIRFEDVGFRYPGADSDALKDVRLTIPAGSTVGFVGATGAGKTTAIDLLLGLLAPTEGRILIDGRSMDAIGVRMWQRSLGYVPQNIYLADLSVAQNIAFGVDTHRIDQKAVEQAARIARIHDFVVGLPHGYETEIGDRGVRISGGQRQRLGIARALYHNPSVLVFDEATSALDTATEQTVMDAVQELAGEKTIILIAHRLSTVQSCDEIFVLDEGRLQGTGTFEELKATNPTFQRLAVA